MAEPGRVIAIAGVTAGGKTDAAERVAAALGGEVVCADSRQVYRELDIGTGQPDRAARARLPHHLFDALAVEDAGAPGHSASAGWYAAAARETCGAIHARGRVPVLVGGSGLYLRAALEGLAPLPPVEPGIRERVRAELAREGALALHARLAAMDPETAARVAPRDAQRVSRALEVLESSGRPLSFWLRQRGTHAVHGAWRCFELTVPPRTLRERIAARTRWMFDQGLADEVRALRERGLGAPLARLRAIGYDEAAALLDGAIPRAEAERRTSLRTGQLAKRQRTWFRHQLAAERLDAGTESAEAIAHRVLAALGRPVDSTSGRD